MRTVTIEAFNGIGKDKVLAGAREVQQPETIAEALQLEGGKEDEVLANYWSSKVIEVQRQIRAGTTMSAAKKLAAIMAVAAANPDSEVAKTLAALDIKVPEAHHEGQAPTTPSEEKKEEAKQARKRS